MPALPALSRAILISLVGALPLPNASSCTRRHAAGTRTRARVRILTVRSPARTQVTSGTFSWFPGVRGCGRVCLGLWAGGGGRRLVVRRGEWASLSRPWRACLGRGQDACHDRKTYFRGALRPGTPFRALRALPRDLPGNSWGSPGNANFLFTSRSLACRSQNHATCTLRPWCRAEHIGCGSP